MKKEIRDWRIELMRNATVLARQTSQVIGKKNDYYITLWQLEELLNMILTRPNEDDEQRTGE